MSRVRKHRTKLRATARRALQLSTLCLLISAEITKHQRGRHAGAELAKRTAKYLQSSRDTPGVASGGRPGAGFNALRVAYVLQGEVRLVPRYRCGTLVTDQAYGHKARFGTVESCFLKTNKEVPI